METIREVAFMARKILQNELIQCVNKENTKGAYLYGTHLVHTMLGQFTCYKSIVRGGDGDGGLYVSGVGYGHYWVEVRTSTGPVVVDITADQFNLEPVLIRPLSEARFYFHGNQEVVNEHYGRFMYEIGKHAPCDFQVKE